MGRALLERWSEARAWFDRASGILGYDLLQVCLEGPASRLDSTDVSQPALFVASYAALEWLRATNPAAIDGCVATAGLSLGEYTALAFAGVINFDDGVRIVQRRGAAMQAAAELAPSGMVSILGWETSRVAQLCDEARQPGEILQVANLLCPGNIAISGHKASCAKAAELAVAQGALKAIPLPVAGAFHTALMEPAVGPLTSVLASSTFLAPRVPVVSNVDATPHDRPDEIRELLGRQVVSQVRWEDSLRWLLAQGVEQFYEVGPGRVLAGTIKRIDRKMKCENISV